MSGDPGPPPARPSATDEQMQAKMDLSFALANDMVSSWMNAARSKSTLKKTSAAERNEEDEHDRHEMREYLLRPANLGIGAPLPSAASLATARDEANLRRTLTRGIPGAGISRPVNGVAKRGKVPFEGEEEDDEDSRAFVVGSKRAGPSRSTADVFAGGGASQRKKRKENKKDVVATVDAGTSSALPVASSQPESLSVDEDPASSKRGRNPFSPDFTASTPPHSPLASPRHSVPSSKGKAPAVDSSRDVLVPPSDRKDGDHVEASEAESDSGDENGADGLQDLPTVVATTTDGSSKAEKRRRRKKKKREKNKAEVAVETTSLPNEEVPPQVQELLATE